MTFDRWWFPSWWSLERTAYSGEMEQASRESTSWYYWSTYKINRLIYVSPGWHAGMVNCRSDGGGFTWSDDSNMTTYFLSKRSSLPVVPFLIWLDHVWIERLIIGAILSRLDRPYLPFPGVWMKWQDLRGVRCGRTGCCLDEEPMEPDKKMVMKLVWLIINSLLLIPSLYKGCYFNHKMWVYTFRLCWVST